MIASSFFIGVTVVASGAISIGPAVENQRMPGQRKRRFLSLDESDLIDTISGNFVNQRGRSNPRRNRS
jgi:hypothetical protein